MHLFKAKAAAGKLSEECLIDTIVYTRPNVDDEIALATEDNISSTDTLPLSFFDMISAMRDVTCLVVSKRKDKNGNSVTLDPELSIPSTSSSKIESQEVKDKRLKDVLSNVTYVSE